MESYPEDLLVGVFPLVFAVNAIYDPNYESEQSVTSPLPGTGDTNNSNNNNNNSSAASSPKQRSDFDRFLDAMAGSLADEADDTDDNVPLEFPPIIATDQSSSIRTNSLFRPDDDELDDSTDEDLFLEHAGEEDYFSSPGGSATGNVKRKSSTNSNSIRLYAGFNLGRRSSTAHTSSNTSYANALQHGQGFFQRARIVSISTKHGFPPSKDPDGTKSIVHLLKQARTSPQKAQAIFSERPIQGILPAGWLEKHVHALPSVVLVVVKLARKDQKAQDSHLLTTVQNLHHSLVPKRLCKIHVVSLVEDDIAVAQAQQWSLDVSRRIVDSNPNIQQDAHQITLLRAGKDLRSGTDGFPTSVALKRLHRSVRDSSLTYYLGQARRTKEKLAKLSEGGKKRLTNSRQARFQPPRELLPLAIRYCFKIAMYYEFQLKFEKSLKFMAEAYRYTRTYYHHLIRLSTRDNPRIIDDGDDGKLGLDGGPDRSVSISTDDTDGMEVSIFGPSSSGALGDGTEWSSGVPMPPSDMAHQCLAVADWLNFKLLQAGFGSHTEGGLIAADAQWRQHSRVFCSRRFLGGHPIMSEEWYFFCHVAHQRLVMSQLVERHPPRALGDFGNEYDEVLLRCAPWRAYEAAAEALLRAGVALATASAGSGAATSAAQDPKDDSRAPFLGGLEEGGLSSLFEKEASKDHKAKALELVLRAISMFEHDWGKEKLKDAEDPFPHRPWGRFGARLYYLAGGVLVSNEKYTEAATHLEQAVKFSAGWSGIEVAVRRLLAVCYEKSPPADLGEPESNDTIATMTMDTCFKSTMSLRRLLQCLASCSAAIQTPSIPWKFECFDEFDTRLPFSFSVTFPLRSHATCGDEVVANVFLKSNLEYTMTLATVTLLSMAGPIGVPMTDIPGFSINGVVVEPGEECVFSTVITIPKNLDDIVVDESTQDNEKMKKNIYSKSARPRTSGITAAAGARLVSEEDYHTKTHNSNGQWSLNFLGGKPLRCDGLQLELSPLIEGGGTSNTKPIELVMVKKRPETPANVKRTPFEEDNYIASAWSRPLHFPKPNGPRCLRVLGPLAGMEITNLTQCISDGRALEGTINRICLKLQAGSEEACRDIKINIACTTTVFGEDGTTKNLSLEDPEDEKTISMKDPLVRAPILVGESQGAKTASITEYGFDVPPGWSVIGTGQEMGGLLPQSPSLARGEATYAFFELYRPTALSPGDNAAASPMCQTNFEVSVSYNQEKDNKTTANVSQKFNGSVLWTPPMKAFFERGSKNFSPCGSRHPSNFTDGARPNEASIIEDIPITDGENVSIRGCLESNVDLESCGLEIKKVRFEAGDDTESPCHLKVNSTEKDESAILFRAQEEDRSRWLKKESKLSFVFAVHVDMKDKKRSATFPLGLVAVDWNPRGFALPDEVIRQVGFNVKGHGPLVLGSPLTAMFQGPKCYIEKAPFKTTFQCTPPVPKVSIPFEINYSITNDTNTHQQLSVVLDGVQNEDTEYAQDVMVCGLVRGSLRLAPFETQHLSYVAIATKPGMTTLPPVCVSSSRYSSWVVNERVDNARPVCIMP